MKYQAPTQTNTRTFSAGKVSKMNGGKTPLKCLFVLFLGALLLCGCRLSQPNRGSSAHSDKTNAKQYTFCFSKPPGQLSLVTTEYQPPKNCKTVPVLSELTNVSNKNEPFADPESDKALIGRALDDVFLSLQHGKGFGDLIFFLRLNDVSSKDCCTTDCVNSFSGAKCFRKCGVCVWIDMEAYGCPSSTEFIQKECDAIEVAH